MSPASYTAENKKLEKLETIRTKTKVYEYE
jgi:hypothetical protein